MSKFRLKFSKLGRGQYISHLDMLRTFTRSITRANLPVLYSQGFNPHQLITFAMPLPIGVTSETEFADIDFKDGTTPVEIMEKLILPPDLKLLDVAIPIHKAKSIISAEYKITLTHKNPDTDKIRDFFERKEVIVSKKSKRSVSDVNIMEFIHSAKIVGADDPVRPSPATPVRPSPANKTTILAVLSAGNEKNLKPDLLVTAMEEHAVNTRFDSVSIHRTNIFCENNGKIEIFS